MASFLVSAITWDPQIRGAIIVLTAVVVLIGSVYLLLMTNTGARLGFLLAAAGLTGWMVILGIVWTVFGIGLLGRINEWKTEEIVTGPVEQSGLEAMRTFPDEGDGWERLQVGNPVLADAQAAADGVLAPQTDTGAEHGGSSGGETAEPEFPPPFSTIEDYVQVGGFRKGGEKYGGIGRFRFFHKPHYAVIQVQPVVEQEAVRGQAPPTPRADTTQPLTTVVMVRDLGSRRLPPFVITCVSAVLFALVCGALHRRDKALMADRARTTAPAPA